MTHAPLPPSPYYAVIFTSQRKPGDNGYDETAVRMGELAKTMPGYIGVESVRGESGFGITVAYWESEEAILNWKRQGEHLEAQRKGRSEWYEDYTVRVARVERAYGMNQQGRRQKEND